MILDHGFIKSFAITKKPRSTSFRGTIYSFGKREIAIEEFNINDVVFLGPFDHQSTTTHNIQQPVIVDTLNTASSHPKGAEDKRDDKES
nr:hypothetical protein [Tanacetum cinerariifolium]